jgi:hypothetical protein
VRVSCVVVCCFVCGYRYALITRKVLELCVRSVHNAINFDTNAVNGLCVSIVLVNGSALVARISSRPLDCVRRK